MPKTKKNLGLLTDSSPETVKDTHVFSHLIVWAIIICLLIFFLWAKYAVLDEVTVGEGKVIPSRQVQVVQNLEGGIVREILVKQGDLVQRGQILMRLEDVLFASKFKELERKLEDVQIELIRLQAEIENKPLVFDKKIEAANPDLVMSEIAFYKARQDEKKQMLRDIELATKELEMTKPLIKKGAASPVEVLRLERTVSELQGKLHAFNSKTLERYNEAKGEVSRLQEEMQGDKDRVSRTTIRSPVKGIVNQLKVNTVGGVIKPGMDILEIVPLDDTLLIEAKIRPADIGFIRLGQKAMVKLSAYDFSIYGGLEGEVEQISADTIVDEEDKERKSYYLIRVRTQKNYLGTKNNPLYIIPGMQATVDILTGRKSVLDYLLKPLLKAKQTALRER
ncbi:MULTISPECIES: HlyD family type I secretion periplasmic adaptor subunit [Legionella]|uniref:HlyD family type I secretion periplasmic adaptor subunit n=1 Tax=Legionella TaxID=445 RepID=UPI000F8C9DE2|nr:MULTISPECIES: HlyD family type I secretion periplasmic adaptor subunit [Legionella]MCP0914125.1 HlyD family type I secretion periplasmic adaptor subunit [Legionella sp. 27cVA30]RUR10180.1 HlyD family type I secretion periplasmic adaptor subunit [Legionella septentrionalis]RUR15808.1 HlyD family type I secretion periplasmic adaptor subunit [Legionella septentrionalis]